MVVIPTVRGLVFFSLFFFSFFFFLIGSAFTVVGGVVSWYMIPDMSRELETEDARFMAYLEDHGYDVNMYGEAVVVHPRLSHDVRT